MLWKSEVRALGDSPLQKISFVPHYCHKYAHDEHGYAKYKNPLVWQIIQSIGLGLGPLLCVLPTPIDVET